MRTAMLLVSSLAIVSAGCASDVARRLDSIDARLAAIEAKAMPPQPPASLSELAGSARVARVRRDVIVSNLSNVETTGFKRRDLGDGDVVRLDVSQGPMENTDRQLDVAINGAGFFRVTTPDGVAYTRAGNLLVSPDGRLVLGGHGDAVLDPPIVLPKDVTELSINDGGTVYAQTPATTRPAAIGRVQLARFANGASLVAVDPTLFRESPASGPPVVGVADDAEFGTVQQGFTEGSNVNELAERARLADAEAQLARIERTLQRYDVPTTSPARPAR